VSRNSKGSPRRKEFLSVETGPENGGSSIPDGAQMQSFIVKIWREEAPQGSAGARWRGHVTHVPEGYRVYVKSLQEISFCIAPYLQRMGVRLGIGWRLWKWMLRNKQ
jgi:hypothetical protein